MPAQLDDPTSPQQFRRSGPLPHPQPNGPLPANVVPREVTLRDRITPATILPFNSPSQMPASLVSYLCDEFAREVERGDTYPMLEPMSLETFAPYWFGVFGTVMLAGNLEAALAMVDGSAAEEPDWSKVCLGSFYTKPNYPGRSSHVCNAGFLVTDAARNKGIGRLLGEAYLDWAPKLGYSYSVFNLVYETNVASCRIWDSLGFKRIGRVPKCGNLKSFPDRLVDAIIYGRELGAEGEDVITEERFDKIRFYLTHNAYPQGADRAEKSRLRSAATHYRLVPSADPSQQEPLLMLKDKEVVADPARQYDIAHAMHLSHQHGGINKTTASIAERYHWVRIKETVSAVIRNCADCRDAGSVRLPATSGPEAAAAAGAAPDSASHGRSNGMSSQDVGHNMTTVAAGAAGESQVYFALDGMTADHRRADLSSDNVIHLDQIEDYTTPARRQNVQTVSPREVLAFPLDPQLMASEHPSSHHHTTHSRIEEFAQQRNDESQESLEARMTELLQKELHADLLPRFESGLACDDMMGATLLQLDRQTHQSNR